MRVLLFAVSVCVFSGWLASCALNPRGDLPSTTQDDGDLLGNESEPEPFGASAEATLGDDDAETVVEYEPEVVAAPEPEAAATEGDDATVVEPSPVTPEPPLGAGGFGSEPGTAGGSGGSGVSTNPQPPDGGAGAPDGGDSGAPSTDGGRSTDGGPTSVFDGGVPPVP